MKKPKKIKGFNPKEQKIYEMLADGDPHAFADMKKLFVREAKQHCPLVYNAGWGDHEVDVVSQSMARNAVRRLIRDGWVEQCARGTYRLTRTGKSRRDKGVDETPSFGTPRGRPPKKKKKTAKKAAKKKKQQSKKKKTKAAPKKKKDAKKKQQSKKTSKKAAAKQATTKKKKAKTKATSSKGNGVSAKAKEAAKRAKKAAAQEKASAAAERAKKAAADAAAN